MKSFCKLFSLLLLWAVGMTTMVAQISSGYYRIQSQRDNKMLRVDGQTLRFSASTTPTTNDVTQLWKVETVGAGYRFISVANGKAVQAVTQVYTPHVVGETPSTFYLKAEGENYLISRLTNPTGHNFLHNDGNNRVVLWEGNGGGNQWRFLRVEEPEATYAHNFMTMEKNQVTRLRSTDGKYAAVSDGKVMLRDTPDATENSDLWVMEDAGGRFILRNYKTGFSLSDDGDATTTLGTRLNDVLYSVQLSGSNNGTYHIGRSTTLTDAQFLTASGADVVISAAVTNAAPNAAAEWTLETVATPAFAQAKSDIRQRLGIVGQVTSGNTYRLVNRLYARHATGMMGSGLAVGEAADEADYNQVWKIETLGQQYSLQHIVTEKYLDNSAGRSKSFLLGQTAKGFTFTFVDRVLPYVMIRGVNEGVHCAETQGYQLVGWDQDADASLWYVQPAVVDDALLAAARATIQLKLDVDQNRETINARLETFFEDAACTVLKAAYRNIGEAQLRSQMSDLPTAVVDMAVRVQQNRWRENDLANRYEKDFRIADYQAHSDPSKWAQRPLLPIMTSFSRLSNPTGISARKGETVLLYVGNDAPEGTTLRAELVHKFDATGAQIDLQKGVNALYCERDQHIYIYYNINETDTKWADVPKMKVHIEGGFANGCYNYERHTNADWKALQSLKGEGFLADEVFRIKSRRQCFSFHLSGIEEQETLGNLHDYDGTYKGVAGVIGEWDKITDIELDFLSVDRYADRFNGLLFASSAAAGTTHATVYGTYYTGKVGTLFSYKELTRGKENDNAGNRWAVAHEVGHHFQQLFDMMGCKESSNNLFSEIVVWKTGSNVSRTARYQDFAQIFNSGKNWTNYGLGHRTRLYWQLWLYYVELGHKPTFFRELFDKFRENPLRHGNANTDFLHFARTCADVAQEDLTDFFTLHGFFNIETGNHRMWWGDAFYDSYYAPVYINVDADDIAATKEYMKRYPKKGANNLFFIEDRTRAVPATYEGAEYGVMRLATSANATPGDPTEVGDVGMYTDYAPGKATQAQPSAVEVDGQTVSIAAPGAVGYKVYDNAGNLVYAANTNTFVLPDRIQDFTVKVAGGNGEEITVVEHGQALPAYTQQAVVDPRFENTASLALSSSKTAPEHWYTIRNPRNNYYATAHTSSTLQAAEAGEFAFFPGVGKGLYRIAVRKDGEVKWLTCNGNNAGSNRVAFSSAFAEATTWTIEREYNDRTFDIIFGADARNNSWNWHGGAANNTSNTMGLYGKYDDNSTWTLTPTTDKTALVQAIVYANNTERLAGVGYPTADAPQRSVLRSAIAQAESQLNGAVTTSQVDALNAAIATYRSDRTHLHPLEDGKVYAVRHFADRRYLSNEPADGESLSAIALPNNSVLWVAQKVGQGYQLVSYKANGFIAKKENAQRGALTTTPTTLEIAAGTLFGAQYLHTDGWSLSGNRDVKFLEAVSAKTKGNDNNRWGTDFYLEEVAAPAYNLTFTECSNGNVATLFLPYAVQLPEGVKAYAASQPSDDVVQLTPLSGNVLPALTAAVLDAPKAGKIGLAPAPYVAPQDLGWKGALVATPNASLDQSNHTYYALRRVDGEALLVQIGTANIPAHRAYLVVPNAGGGTQNLTFVFGDGIVSGIDALVPSVPAYDPAAPLYDLSGRRVHRPVRGQLYLQNGRKLFLP